MNNNEVLLIIFFSLISFIAGRLSVKFRQKKRKYSVPANFLKGIDFLLNNREDEALKEFINAAEINARNAEIYVTLGNLFRKRGDVEKSIRIHKAVLAQQNIDEEVKKIALLNLSRDFRKYGFFQRALNVLQECEKIDKKDINILYEKIKIFSFGNQFENLLNLYKKNIARLDKQSLINFSSIYTKLGKEFIKKGNYFKAYSYLKKSLKIYGANYFTYVVLGDYFFSKKKLIKAKEAYLKAIEINPYTILKLRVKLNRLGTKLDELKGEHFLIKCLAVRDLIINGKISEAKEVLKFLIIENQSVIFLKNLLFIVELIETKDIIALKKVKKILQFSFKCKKCSSIVENFYFQCPFCKNWLTFGD